MGTAPPTKVPTNIPPTWTPANAPTNTTPFPTQTAPTMHPTHIAPTLYPTYTPPTAYPTVDQAPPTPFLPKLHLLHILRDQHVRLRARLVQNTKSVVAKNAILKRTFVGNKISQKTLLTFSFNKL